MSSSTDLRPDWLTSEVWPWAISRLDTPDGPLSYTDTGTGPVVLLVHAGMWSILWRDLIAQLATDHRCIALDAPGNGFSERVDPDHIGVAPAAEAVGRLIDDLDLRDITLVFHDLGGPAAIAAAASRADRVARLIAVNTFAWPAHNRLLRVGLPMMGSAPMAASDVALRWMPRLTSTGIGAGRHWDAATRAAFRRGMDAAGIRSLHRYFASAAGSPAVLETARDALAGVLNDRPLLTVFGRRNDYFGFQPVWRSLFPNAVQKVIPDGNHFPMCDAPGDVARWIREAEVGGPA
jgi:pimeloyl-ACP methyl ester carboxylesterase